jgi:hypothetical protein
MATVTTNDGGSQTLTGTFSKIAGGNVTLTTCTLASGGTLVGSQPFGQYVDSGTATTVNIPLGKITSIV